VRVLPDGEHVLGVSGDDGRLFVARTDGRNEVTASVERGTPQLPPPAPVGPNFDTEGTLVADRVGPGTVEVRRLPGLEPVSVVTVPGTPTAGSDDAASGLTKWHFDRILTLDGPVARWWDPLSGEQVAELDLRSTGLIDGAATGDYFLASYADPDHVVLSIPGDPDSHVVEIATGRVVGTLPFGDDVLATRFQAGTRYVSVLRQGDLLEMWDRVEGRRVLGPLPSLGATNDAPGDVIVQFLPEPGRYLLGDREQLRWYEAGGAAPTRRLDLGADRPPVSASSDGSVALYLDTRIETVFMPPIRIDPAEWRRELCALVDDRAFTADEHAQLPPGTPRRPCP
jgi:hypothetical protein